MLELGDEAFRRGAVESIAVLLSRHLCDDRQIAEAAYRADRRTDLVDIPERLQDEQLDASFEQRRGLLAEVRLRFIDAGLAPRLDADAERSDRAGDVGLFARRMTRDACPLQIDRVRAVTQPEGAELDAIGAERVR